MNSATIAAYEKAAAHYLTGVGIYAVIGALGFVASHETGFNLGTVWDGVITIGIAEGVQAAIKFFKAKQDAFDAPEIPAVPADSQIA